MKENVLGELSQFYEIDNTVDSNDGVIDQKVKDSNRLAYLDKLSRGELSHSSTSSSSSSSSDSEAEYDDNEDDESAESDRRDGYDKNGETNETTHYGESSSRIAVQNADWDHLKSADLL